MRKLLLFTESCHFHTFTEPHFMIELPALFLGCGKHYYYLSIAVSTLKGKALHKATILGSEKMLLNSPTFKQLTLYNTLSS